MLEIVEDEFVLEDVESGIVLKECDLRFSVWKVTV